MHGELLYLYVLTWEDKRFHITASTRGFFVNQSTEVDFNPKASNPNHIGAALIWSTIRRDAIRAEDAFSSKFGYEDWNEELQTTREFPRKSLPDRLLRERAIFKVHSDFVAAAMRGAIWGCYGWQCVRVYSTVDQEGLYTLGTVILDYRGYRVTAQYRILEREQEESVVYGSIDFGKTVVIHHSKYLELLSKVGQQLKTLPHEVVSEKGEQIELWSSVESK
uniref:Clu domain-containing protein n=1 Tax=Strigamia maritima TaxID=126957 RepID=T1JB87_STRMM